MQQTEFELSLVSSEPEGDYNPEVTLDITAYFQSSRIYDENTLTFHCDPVGSNYRSSYLRITLEDWSTVVGIRDFLADCFSDDTIDRRAMTVDVDTAITSISPTNRPPTEKENLDEITIGVDGNRIEFYRSSRLHPYIHTYERKIDNVPQDHTNAEKLLRSWVEDCWSVLTSRWKSQQARVTHSCHPTNDVPNQDVCLGASSRKPAGTGSLA